MLAAGVAVGGCGIWTMHFLGMSAEILTITCTGERVPLEYNLPITVASLFVAIISSAWSMYFVLPVEKTDNDKVNGVTTLKDLQRKQQTSQKGHKRKNKEGPEYWVLPFKVQGRLFKLVKVSVLRFVAATCALALGALGMHYMVRLYERRNCATSAGL
jgi:NO-binding membrane sensor protein with MHYT domain